MNPRSVPSVRFALLLWIVLCQGTILLLGTQQVDAEPPFVNYIFPAGGQRGTTVDLKVGGHYLHESASFSMLGEGIKASSTIQRVSTTWFEGPFIPMPASQAKEDYPKDYKGQVTISPKAKLGTRRWFVSTSQGVFVLSEISDWRSSGNSRTRD